VVLIEQKAKEGVQFYKSNQDMHGHKFAFVTPICEYRFVTVAVHEFIGFSFVSNLNNCILQEMVQFSHATPMF
jgi:hypothetical protein